MKLHPHSSNSSNCADVAALAQQDSPCMSPTDGGLLGHGAAFEGFTYCAPCFLATVPRGLATNPTGQ